MRAQLRRVLGLGVALGSALLAPPARPQEAVPSPAADTGIFPSQVEQVTVDVVVLDRRGEPVAGLGRGDFTVLDEGRPQSLDSFELVRAEAAGPAGDASRPRVATNLVRSAEAGRLFVIFFDDVHLSPLNARAAKAAVASFLETGTREGDRILLVASGGGAWWSARLPGGRADLLAVLKHLDGRRIPDNALERMTDYEAVQIAVYHDYSVAARVQDRFERYGTASRQALQQSQAQQMVESMVPGVIDPYVEIRATEAYVKLKARAEVTLGVLERCLKGLEDVQGRKSVLLVSEGFVHDPSNPGFKRVTQAARRSNAALYFVDTRGLQGLSAAYSAEFGNALDERDLMKAIADVSLEGEGAVGLAADTGGFSVRDTNDFASGTVRIGRESRSYYLLGYSPGEIPQDGRFRKIEVRVRGKGLTVRARRGYYAPGGPPAAQAAAAAKGEVRDQELQRVLDAPGAADAIPLRVTAYTLQPSGSDKAQVLLAAEADVSKVAFPEGGGNAVLDTLLVASHRETGDLQRSDVKVELQRRDAPVPTGQPVWYSFTRTFELKAGGYQAKLLVRDAATRRVGSVILDFEVPPLDGLRLSTPLLTDTLQRGEDGTLAPAIVVRREFRPDGQLFCRFDVYGAARGPDGMPRVKAGHALRRPGGPVLGQSPAHTIQPTSIGALSRLIQIPLAGTAPGDYELVLTVSDEVSGQTRETAERFTVSASTATATR